MMIKTYMTAAQLAEVIPYHKKYINDSLKDTYLFEGVHYIRPFGGKRVLYIWEEVEKTIFTTSIENSSDVIPMMNGGACRV